MCTFLKTSDIGILIDPGVSLGPRYGMLPHPTEYKLIYKKRSLLREIADKSDIITVSHYHHDHYTPSYEDTVFICSDKEQFQSIYRDKQVLVKDFHEKINHSQRRRGWIFQKSLKKIAKGFENADGRIFKFGETTLKFSDPVSHGEDNSMFGWVLMMSIEKDGNKIIHSSDIQGPSSTEALRWILAEGPNLLILSGPPVYLRDYLDNKTLFSSALKNMKKLTENISTIVIDHHLIRAKDWVEQIAVLRDYAKDSKNQVLTATELNNQENNALEAKRNLLYEDMPPSKEFLKWTKLPKEKRRQNPPPIT